MTPEWKLQKKITDFLEKQQWCICVKQIKTNLNWMPDLLILPWDWICYFIEVKTKTGKLSELQKYRIKKFEEMWYVALVPYGWEDFLEQFNWLRI